jgi:hypothetical protein
MDHSSDSEDACFAFFADRSDFALTTGGAFGSATSEALTALGYPREFRRVGQGDPF